MSPFSRHFKPLSVLLLALAAVAVAAALIWTVNLEFVIERTSDAVFQSAVGSRLRRTALISAGILAAGLLFGWPSIWGEAGTAVVRSGTAVTALALVISAGVTAYGQEHPSFAIEKRAIAAFWVPGGSRPAVTTDVRAQRLLSATWTIPATASSVCPQISTALAAWADPGSVSRPKVSAGNFAGTARRGPDDVTLTCVSAPAPGSPVDVIIDLERVR